MAAITGFGEFSMVACTSGRLAPFMAPPNSVMSAPAMKVRPSQISTPALASEAMACLKPSNSPSRTLADRAFTGGEFRVTTATSPSRARVVTSLIWVMGAFLEIGLSAALCLAAATEFKRALQAGLDPAKSIVRMAPQRPEHRRD